MRTLDDLERIRCLWMSVLVWVELNRQFAVKLDHNLWLHRRHIRYNHLCGGIKNLVDHMSLLLSHSRSLRLLSIDKFLSKHCGLLLNLLLHHTLSLSIFHEHSAIRGHVAVLQAIRNFFLHLLPGFSEHLLLHHGIMSILDTFFLALTLLHGISLIFATPNALHIIL